MDTQILFKSALLIGIQVTTRHKIATKIKCWVNVIHKMFARIKHGHGIIQAHFISLVVARIGAKILRITNYEAQIFNPTIELNWHANVIRVLVIDRC